MEKENSNSYISLQEAIKLCNYSQEYLSLRARQGKLKAIKLGRNWVTTQDWLNTYLGKVEEYNNNNHIKFQKPFTVSRVEPPENLPMARLVKAGLMDRASFAGLRPALATALVFVLLTGGGVLAKETLLKFLSPIQGFIVERGDRFLSDFSQGGDIVGKAIGSQRIFLGETSITLGEAGGGTLGVLGDYFKWISDESSAFWQRIKTVPLAQGYAAANDFLEKRISQDIQKLKKGYLLANSFIEEKYWAANGFLEKKLAQIPRNLEKGYSVANEFVERKIATAYQFVSSPWRWFKSDKELGVGREEFEQLKLKMEEFEKEPVVVERVEVSKVVEPVKEITKETIQQVTKVDDAALAEVRSYLAYLEEEIAKRLYAPGGVVSQTIYVTEPISSPKIYQENGEIVLQTAGSGNVILSAATGLQLYGQQVVIKSTSLLSPLIYLATNTKIDGDLTLSGGLNIGGALGVGGGLSISGDLTINGNLTLTGNLTITGNTAITGTFSTTATTTLAVSQGYVGIGTSTPSSNLAIAGNIMGSGNLIIYGMATSTLAGPLAITTTTTNQLKLSYDSTNYTNFTTDSAGDLTIAPSGEDVTITGNLLVTGSPNYTGGASFLVPVTITTTTAPQFLVRYDADNELNVSLAEDGAVELLATGTDADLELRTENFDNAIFIDDSTGHIGIGTTTPDVTLAVQGTDAVLVPFGTDAQRPTGMTGMMRFNTDATIFEGYNGTNWTGLGGVIDVNRDTYILAESTSGANEDALFFYTGGSEKMRIDTAGNLGIATTSPRYTLDVWGDMAVGTSTDTNTPILFVDTGNGGQVGIGTTTLSGLLTVGTTTPALVVDPNGYVGIGTTTPEEALHVVGNALISGDIVTIAGDIMPSSPRTQDIGSAAFDWYNIYGFNIYANNIYAASTTVSGTTAETFTINSDATEDATSSLRYYRGTDTPHALLTWDADFDQFNFNFPVYLSGTTGSLTSVGALTIASGGTGDIVLSPANYVGVATTTPRYTLDVWGDFAVGTSSGVGVPTDYPLLFVDSGEDGGSDGVGIGTTTVSGTMLTVGTTTPALVVTDTGDVGVGTASPTKKFQVSGGDIALEGDSYSLLSTGGGVTIGDNYDDSVIIRTGTGDNFLIYTNSGSEVARFTSTGNVGIGTTNPTSLLTVFGGNLAVSDGTATSTISNGNISLDYGMSAATSSITATSTAASLAIGTSNFYVSENGKVGIGTASPETKLDISGGQILLDNNQPLMWERSNGDNLNIMKVDDAASNVVQFSSAGGGFNFSQENFGTSLMTIQNGGNVGIATTSPRYTLDVWGDFAVGTSTAWDVPALYVDSGNGGYVGIGTTTVSGTLLTVGTTTPALVVANNGYVGVGTANPNYEMQISGTLPDLQFTDSDVGTGLTNGVVMTMDTADFNIWNYQTGYIRLATNNAERLRVDSSGNVGIGTTTPGHLLTVAGGDIVVASGGATTTLSYGNSTFASNLTVGGNLTVSGDIDAYMSWAGATSTLNSYPLWSQASTTYLALKGGGVVTASTTFNATTSIDTGGFKVGTQSLYINEDGLVGIGTVNPTQALDITGNIMVGSGGSNWAQFLSGSPAVVKAAQGLGFNVNNTTRALTIDTLGNVGIGTTTSGHLLTVAGGNIVIASGGATTTLSYGNSTFAGNLTVNGDIDAYMSWAGATSTLNSYPTWAQTTTTLNVYAEWAGVTSTLNYYVRESFASSTYFSIEMATNTLDRFVEWAGATTTLNAYAEWAGVTSTLDSYPTWPQASSTYIAKALTEGYVLVGSNAGLASATSTLFVDADMGYIGIGTTTPYAKLTINESDDFAFGSFNASTVDTMEGSLSDWNNRSNDYVLAAAETSIVKVGSQSLKIYASSTCEDLTVAKEYASAQDWSDYERLGFWIYADKLATSTATTTQIISLGIYGSSNDSTSTHNIYIQEEDEWQYEEWNIYGVQNTTSASNVFFKIEVGETSTFNFYIDQMRLYNDTERSAEMLVDKNGTLVVTGRGGVELVAPQAGAGALPGVKVDGAVVELGQPLSVNTGGDVGFDYDIQFLNTGLAQITSEGPLRIAAGDSNHSENLTLTTGGSGDVIVELTASSSAFMVAHGWDASNTIPFIINSETNSTSSVDVDASGVLFQVISDVDSDENVVFTIDAGGSYRYDMTGATPASDVAEKYYVEDETIEGGDVVCLNGTPLTVEKCSGAYQSKLIGVISTKPALLMAVDFENARPVALNGRVPVKVSSEAGSIAIGDPLTSASSSPGLAMKATKVGKILGYALEPFEGSATSSDIIMAFVSLSERSGGDLTVYQNDSGQIEIKILTESGLAALFSIDEEGAMVVEKLKTQQLCVGGLCVTEEDFLRVFGGSTSTDEEAEPPACENGENRSCSTDVGACQIGVEICEQGVWGECIGAVFPQDELCDEVDNDCDGEVDEGDICSGVSPEPPDCGITSCDAGLNLTGSCQNTYLEETGCQTCTPTCSCTEGFSDCDGDAVNGCEFASSTCPTL